MAYAHGQGQVAPWNAAVGTTHPGLVGLAAMFSGKTPPKGGFAGGPG